MNNKNLWSLILIFILCFGIANIVRAGTQKVTDLKVKGNKSLSGSAILAKVKIRVGDEVSREVLNEDIKRLYGTGYFKDVKVRLESYKEGKKVIFEVKEKPVVKEININGNTIIDTSSILDKMSSKIEAFLSPQTLKSDISNIEQLYADRGFSEAKVDYNVEVDKKSNKATVEINISEGKKLRIEKVNVLGNKAYPDDKILEIIETQRDTLFSSGIYKESVIKEDINRIRSFYRNRGYLDVKAEYETTKTNKNKLIVKIDIREGNKYITGKIKIKGNKKFTGKEIRKNLSMKEGDVFTHKKLKQDIANIQSFYFGKGYIFADLKTDTVLDPKTGRIDVKYLVKEGQLAYIDKIKIKGNTKTKDIVIRRELKIYPGEKFNGKKLRESKRRLDRLGIFQSVSFDTQPGQAPNRKNLVVNVKEAKTGEFSFGAGYSSVDDFLGFIELKQKNFDYKNWPTFTGDGQKIRIKAEFGTVREDYDFSFTEPWIFDKPISFGFDIYQHTRKRERDVGYAYDQRRRGTDVRLGKEITEYLKANLIYRYEEIKISDIAEDTSTDLKEESGENTLSSLKLGFAHDTTDDSYNPTSGHQANFSIETAGSFLGGDKDFLKCLAGATQYYSYFKNQVLELRIRGGVVDEYGDSNTVPIYERFYAGGINTIRGYDVRDVGPKDPESDDPIGGESMLIGNVEYSFPLIKNFKGAVFFDVGNVWSDIGDFGQGGFESSVGTGIRINTPIGPIKLDYGYPLDEDSNGRIHFSMGKRF